MKKLILVLIALSAYLAAGAQQDRQVSHFMYDLISINPGSAGSSEMISTHALMRQQWVGIEGAPRDVVLNLDAPFSLFGGRHGAGLSVWDDEFGVNEDINLSGSYSYRFTAGNGTVGIGVSGSFINRKLDPEWYIPTSDFHDPVSQDAAIPDGKQNEFVFDFGAGVFYRTEESYVGISSTNILQDEFVYELGGTTPSLEAKEKLVRHYYLTAGYTFQLSNPVFELMPSILIQTDARSSKIDLNTIMMYNKKLWAGVSYRVGSAIVGMAGVSILNGVKIGYSYDFDTSALSNYSKGSHEVMVGYEFRIGVERVPQKYKSIRFL
jgi:type IX secretion system PorP/SprF family membrane protein